VVALLNAADAEIHGFRFTNALGSPQMAAALSAKRLYPAIAAFRHLNILIRLASNLDIAGRCWQDGPKWRP